MIRRRKLVLAIECTGNVAYLANLFLLRIVKTRLSTLDLKILVSVVRFRPGPSRTYLAQRQSIVIGVVVSGLRRPWHLRMSTSLIHKYSTASSCVQAGAGQRSIVRETTVREVLRKTGETFTQRIEGRILCESMIHQCERIIGLTSVQSGLHGLRIIATACLYRASWPAGSRRLRDSPQTPQRPIRCNPKQG